MHMFQSPRSITVESPSTGEKDASNQAISGPCIRKVNVRGMARVRLEVLKKKLLGQSADYTTLEGFQFIWCDNNVVFRI